MYRVGALVVEGNWDVGKLGAGNVKAQYGNGDVYEGKMTAHYKKEGSNCKYFFANGDRYEGDYVNDKRQG